MLDRFGRNYTDLQRHYTRAEAHRKFFGKEFIYAHICGVEGEGRFCFFVQRSSRAAVMQLCSTEEDVERQLTEKLRREPKYIRTYVDVLQLRDLNRNKEFAVMSQTGIERRSRSCG